MRLRPSRGYRLFACAAFLCAGTIPGCSNDDEQVTPGAGASAFVPHPQGQASANAKKSLAQEIDLPLPDGLVTRKAKSDNPFAGVPGPGTSALDTRFGANDVEKTVRTAMRAARDGDSATAAKLLDQVLAAEPMNREALVMRAAIDFERWQKEKSPEARAAAIEKAVAAARALRGAYESLKPQETAFSSAVFYGYGQYLCEAGRFDDAIKAIEESAGSSFEPYFLVEKDEKMAALRKLPQYQAALKAHDDARLVAARERVKDKLAVPINLPFQFTHRDLEAKPVSLSDYKGKVVLVDFWGTWCGPCKQTIPHLIDLYNNRKAKGLQVIGLDYEKEIRDESKARELVKPFAKQVGMNYPCVITDDATIQQIPGFKGFPTFVIVDRAGKVRLAITEPDDNSLELMRDVIEVLLEEPPPPAGPAKQPTEEAKKKGA
jgi:thiol-disulfide isomerase/thioredoxin